MEQKGCKGTTNVLENKSVQRNKNVQGNKKCAQGTKKFNLLWHMRVLNCRVCPYMALWPRVVLYGLV